VALLDEAMAGSLGGEGGSRDTVVFTSCHMIASCSRCAEFERAVQWVRAADRFTKRFGCPFLWAFCRTLYGGVLYAAGDWGQAEEELQAAVEMSKDSLAALHGQALASMAELRLAQGRVEEAERLVSGFEDYFVTAPVVAPDGRASVYRKTHLYPAELDCFTAGQSLDTVASPAGVLGPLLCFEHAFPDIATTLALAGAQILVIPSAVPYGFEHLLELRTRARAQDNQVFAVGCNMVGHGFCGRSLVTDPVGDVVVRAGGAETVLRVRLDLSAIAQERAREPALRLRRPELYLPPSDDD
jgi:predicted amidohydrolase